MAESDQRAMAEGARAMVRIREERKRRLVAELDDARAQLAELDATRAQLARYQAKYGDLD